MSGVWWGEAFDGDVLLIEFQFRRVFVFSITAYWAI